MNVVQWFMTGGLLLGVVLGAVYLAVGLRRGWFDD